MIDQRPQDRGGRGAAERADEGPVIGAGPPLPAAVAGGHPRGVVEQVRSLGEHFRAFCHCEPTGRREAPPDDRLREAIHKQRSRYGLLRRFAPRNDALIVPPHIMAATANSMTSEVMVLRIQRVAPRWTPGCFSPCGEVPRTGTFQISSAYSRMVRSEENHGIRATLRIEARVHAGTTCQRASMPRWAS